MKQRLNILLIKIYNCLAILSGIVSTYSTIISNRIFAKQIANELYTPEQVHALYMTQITKEVSKFDGKQNIPSTIYLVVHQLAMFLAIVIPITILFFAIGLPLYILSFFSSTFIIFWFSILGSLIGIIGIISILGIISFLARRLRQAGLTPLLLILLLLPYGLGFVIIGFLLFKPEKVL